MRRKGASMNNTTEQLLHRVEGFQAELGRSLKGNEQAFHYQWVNGKARFEAEIRRQHQKLRVGLLPYILHSRLLVVLTMPLIYVCVIPLVALDLVVSLYQAVCFPIYGIPKVSRGASIVFDRGRLRYLNSLERVNCIYCSYANGLCAYVTEIAARTEQHWCPIKHAQRLQSPHSRYAHFLDYGDAERYRREIEHVRRDFADVEEQKPAEEGKSEHEADGNA